MVACAAGRGVQLTCRGAHVITQRLSLWKRPQTEKCTPDRRAPLIREPQTHIETAPRKHRHVRRPHSVTLTRGPRAPRHSYLACSRSKITLYGAKLHVCFALKSVTLTLGL